MYRLRSSAIGLCGFLIVLIQFGRALAGTTGSLAGHVVTETGLPLAAAVVSAVSPAQSSSTTTDANGSFAFASLMPGDYRVTVTKDGYSPTMAAGVTVHADLYQSIGVVRIEPLAHVIDHIGRWSNTLELGTPSDVYSLDPAKMRGYSPLGGGGSLDQAYGAIASQPGVVVPAGQSGWAQAIHIRGGDSNQVGYEFDGVPVLRPYDNYPTTTESTLGQQELQIYSGGAPTDAQTQGLAGYINQVTQTGSYPGFATMDLVTGSPALYDSAKLEVGGATQNGSFSYFLALGSSAQGLRWFDNSNGAGIQSMWGAPFARLTCPGGSTAKNFSSCYATGIGPGGYALGPPVDAFAVAQVWDHESILNLHFGIPHRSDPGKDDIQLLYDNSYLHDTFYGSASDWTLTGNKLFQQLNGDKAYHYLSGRFIGYQYLGAVGQLLNFSSPQQLASMVNDVFYAYNPDSIRPNLVLPPIPTGQRDGTANPNSIIKLQYQHDMGAGRYVRVYGFQNWSLWPRTCPDSAWSNYVVNCPFNEYVDSYSSGITAQYVDQAGDKNLIDVDASDLWATEYDSNDETMINEFFGLNHNVGSDAFLYAVNSKRPTDGVCYNQSGNPVSCYSFNAVTIGLCQAIGDCSGGSLPSLPASCGGAPCAWFVAENGRIGSASFVKPNFGSLSLHDQYKASERLLVDVGARYSRYIYRLADTGGPARDFWFNSWNDSYCVLPGAGQVPFYNSSNDSQTGGQCPSVNGLQSVRATMTNAPNDSETFTDIEPRLGATYTVSAHDVVRFNYGRYTQAPNTSLEQPSVLQQDLASTDGRDFLPAGFTSTTHRITPPTADDVDASWLHDFGAGTTFNVTPFLRRTHDQIQNFSLNARTGFNSGLNAADQTSDGIELQVDREWLSGLGGLLSLTFTHSSVRYESLGNGGSVLATIDLAIQQYNSFTSACRNAQPSTNPNAPCGTFGNANAVATESNGVANPYFNAPAQPVLDLGGSYVPFDTVPGAVESDPASYETPLSAALLLTYRPEYGSRWSRWRFAPQFQYFAGGYYGDPLTGWGVNPAACSSLNGSIAGDPRYPYGGSGLPYDAQGCFGRIPVPDPYTHRFDGMGAFRGPNRFLMHALVSYDASERVSLALDLENVVNRCWGGTAEPWTAGASNSTCGYVAPGYGAPIPYGSVAPTSAGGFFNPGSSFQPIVEFPYQQNRAVAPFQAYVDLQIKL